MVLMARRSSMAIAFGHFGKRRDQIEDAAGLNMASPRAPSVRQEAPHRGRAAHHPLLGEEHLLAVKVTPCGTPT